MAVFLATAGVSKLASGGAVVTSSVRQAMGNAFVEGATLSVGTVATFAVVVIMRGKTQTFRIVVRFSDARPGAT